ncbi:MAG: hypothetical protein Q4G61_06290 [Tissierellia bacterium]|nr:hypothetical protein [Tissierellia bacterium]
MKHRILTILLILALALLGSGCTQGAVIEKLSSNPEIQEAQQDQTVDEQEPKTEQPSQETASSTSETAAAEPSGDVNGEDPAQSTSESAVYTESTGPIHVLSPGSYGVENNLSLENGIYDLVIKGSGKLSITDADYFLVADENFPGTGTEGEIRYRVSILEGYSITVGEGLTVEIHPADYRGDSSPLSIYSGYWLISEEIKEGMYRVTLQNVYGDNAQVSIYANGELLDTYNFVKGEDNDSYRDIELKADQVLVISGIQTILLEKLDGQ